MLTQNVKFQSFRAEDFRVSTWKQFLGWFTGGKIQKANLYLRKCFALVESLDENQVNNLFTQAKVCDRNQIYNLDQDAIDEHLKELNEKAKLLKTQNTLTTTIAEKEDEITQLKNELVTQKTRLKEKYSAEINAEKETINALENILEDKNQTIEDLKRQITNFQNDAGKQVNKEIKQENDKLKTEIEGIKKELNELKTELASAHTSKEEITLTLNKQIENLTNKNDLLTKKTSTVETHFTALNDDLNATKSALAKAEALTTAKEKTIQEATTKMIDNAVRDKKDKLNLQKGQWDDFVNLTKKTSGLGGNVDDSKIRRIESHFSNVSRFYEQIAAVLKNQPPETALQLIPHIERPFTDFRTCCKNEKERFTQKNSKSGPAPTQLKSDYTNAAAWVESMKNELKL